MSHTNGTYYLWKWSDNNLPGPPHEVFSELLKGRLHPAIQSFDARPMINDLHATAATRHALGEEWQWQVQPAESPEYARFIFLRCPKLASHGVFCPDFKRLVYPWGLSGYDEQEGDLIDCLLPKLNAFVLKIDPTETHFDIGEDDLPILLGRLNPNRLDTAYVVNSVGNWVECTAYPKGFTVEWTEGRNRIDETYYDHLRVGRLEHWDDSRKPRYQIHRRHLNDEWHTIRFKEYPQENLRFSETVTVFRAFLRGEPRPSQYHWRSIRQDIERAKRRLRKANPRE